MAFTQVKLIRYMAFTQVKLICYKEMLVIREQGHKNESIAIDREK